MEFRRIHRSLQKSRAISGIPVKFNYTLSIHLHFNNGEGVTSGEGNSWKKF